MDSIKQYMRFVKPYIWHILWTIIIGVLKFAIPLLIPLILKYVIDTIIEGDMTQSAKITQLFWLMGISFVVFLILRPPIEYIRQYLAQLVDRKSTRLNSSHVAISYAVYCLKKKVHFNIKM